MKVSAVVVAAGESKRMGMNKLLVSLCGKKLIDHILDALEASETDEIIVVLGHRQWEVYDLIKSRTSISHIVINEDYEEGMSSTFKTGLKYASKVDATFLILGDQLVRPRLLNAMIKKMEGTKNLIVSPVFAGKKGHPVLFSKELFPEILTLEDTSTVRDLIHGHLESVAYVRGDKWTIMDIDTPADLARARMARLKR